MLEKYIGELQLPYGINLIDILAILILILFIINIISYFGKRKLKNKIQEIPGLDINQKLASDILMINQKLEELTRKNTEFRFNISNLENKTKQIKNIKSIKYNPYKDMGVGGQQSFSTLFIDENGNGVILTNLYSRERTRVLLKEIENWNPKQELAPEEKELLLNLKQEKMGSF